MEINKLKNGTELTVVLKGRLDTNTAPELEAELQNALEGIERLAFDIKELDYISSAGLRVLLSAQKIMNKQGSMVVRNAQAPIVEIFEVTGFTDILTLEND